MSFCVDEGNSEGLFARGNFGRNIIVNLGVDEKVKNRSPASVYEGESGRFKEQLQYDQTVNEALIILQNNAVYNSVFAVEN